MKSQEKVDEKMKKLTSLMEQKVKSPSIEGLMLIGYLLALSWVLNDDVVDDFDKDEVTGGQENVNK